MSNIVTVAWIIDHSKISDYLLNTQHERGASKAKYLIGFGFSPDQRDVLAQALVDHAMSNMPGRIAQAEQGPHRVVFEGMVLAPDGRQMPLRTVWMAYDPPPEMRFITAVPLTGKASRPHLDEAEAIDQEAMRSARETVRQRRADQT